MGQINLYVFYIFELNEKFKDFKMKFETTYKFFSKSWEFLKIKNKAEDCFLMTTPLPHQSRDWRQPTEEDFVTYPLPPARPDWAETKQKVGTQTKSGWAQDHRPGNIK